MITEAFILTCNDEKAYLHIDRSYQYGGIMLLADALNGICLGGIDGCTCFEEFSLDKWLGALGVSDAVITFRVHDGCDGMINSSIYKDKMGDILSVTIENGTVMEVKTSNNEIIYIHGDDYIGDWEVGWLGKVYEYYTKQLSYEIEEHTDEYDSRWGVYYPEAYYR